MKGERGKNIVERASLTDLILEKKALLLRRPKFDGFFLKANQTIHRLFNLTRGKEDLFLLLYLCQEKSFSDHVQKSERYSGS